jgi:para-nitrobenzyl esterase
VLPDPAAVVNPVPLLTGLTADETSSGAGDWNAADPAALAALLERRFGGQARHFASLYQGGDPESARAAARALLRERGIASMLAWEEAHRTPAMPVHAYLFTHVPPGPSPERFGSFHSAEIPYAFGTLEPGDRAFTAADRAIAQRMMDYWVNFVRSGDPNGRGLPHWPRLDEGRLMALGDRFEAQLPLAPAKARAYRDYLAAGGALSMF